MMFKKSFFFVSFFLNSVNIELSNNRCIVGQDSYEIKQPDEKSLNLKEKIGLILVSALPPRGKTNIPEHETPSFHEQPKTFQSNSDSMKDSLLMQKENPELFERLKSEEYFIISDPNDETTKLLKQAAECKKFPIIVFRRLILATFLFFTALLGVTLTAIKLSSSCSNNNSELLIDNSQTAIVTNSNIQIGSLSLTKDQVIQYFLNDHPGKLPNNITNNAFRVMSFVTQFFNYPWQIALSDLPKTELSKMNNFPESHRISPIDPSKLPFSMFQFINWVLTIFHNI